MTDTNQASELFELCKEVYERTGFKDTLDFAYKSKSGPWLVQRANNYDAYPSWWLVGGEVPSDCTPLYTSDYLLEKLPEEVKKRVLVVTNGDRPHAGYAERDNYGNYTLDEYYWKNAQYSNEVRKALLKLIIALSDAGELK